MISSVAVGQSMFRVIVVPARAAYLIRAGDQQGAVRAVREASTRWAGVSEPIIPVSSSGSVEGWWRQVVDVSGVDGLVNVNLEGEVAGRVAGSLGLPWVELAEIDEAGITRFSTHPGCLRQVGRLAGQTALLSSPGGALWEKIAVGDLTPEAEADSVGGSVVGRRSGGGYELALAQLSETCWLDAGASQFHEYRAEGMFGPTPTIVWVTQPDSLEDCLYYWNLRAIRSFRFSRAPMMLVPSGEHIDWVTVKRVLAGLLARPEALSPDVLIFSLSVEDDDLETVGELLGLEKSESPPARSMVIPPPPPRSAPFTFRHDINPRQYLAVPRRYGETVPTLVQVYRESTVVAVDSPARFTGPGQLLVRLSSSAFDGIPRRPATARLFHGKASWSTQELDEDALQLGEFAGTRHSISLRVPDLSKVTWSLLEEQTATRGLSDKGRLANRLDTIGVSDILLDSNVIEVINYLKTPRPNSLWRELQRARKKGKPDTDLLELAVEWGRRARRRFRSLRQIRGQIDRDAGTAVESLSSHSWAERGLRIKCDQCMMDSFIPIQTATSAPQCPACGATGQTYEPHGDPELHYRLNSLVDRAANQGVIPHLFAVVTLRASSTHTHLLPGVECTFPDGTTKEIDLYGIHGGHVVAGEAKTTAMEFTEEQIERDIKMSTRLAADIHLLVCAEPVPETITTLAGEHADQAGLDLKVIDRRLTT